jgi:23S rRNA (adenine2030-N6)-methyltransferase
VPPYHHGSKAGNYADVHKHWLLNLLLAQLARDAAIFDYLESHSGAGRHELEEASEALVNGVGRLWRSDAATPGIRSYLQIIRQHNPSGRLRHYPGSPLFARHYLAARGRATLFELQPAVYRQLEALLAGDSRFSLQHGDGYAGLSGIEFLPNQATLVLLDPPYRSEEDFIRVKALAQRLATHPVRPCIALWYPLRGDRRQEGLKTGLARATAWSSELCIDGVANSGMCGSGMLLLNAAEEVPQQAERDGAELACLLGGSMRYWRPS